jgi:hypothetical protein
MKDQADDKATIFSIIHTLQGGPSEDGNALRVEAATFDNKVVRFAIPIENIQHFIAFLLIWVGKISAAQDSRPETGGMQCTAAYSRHVNLDWRAAGR